MESMWTKVLESLLWVLLLYDRIFKNLEFHRREKPTMLIKMKGRSQTTPKSHRNRQIHQKKSLKTKNLRSLSTSTASPLRWYLFRSSPTTRTTIRLSSIPMEISKPYSSIQSYLQAIIPSRNINCHLMLNSLCSKLELESSTRNRRKTKTPRKTATIHCPRSPTITSKTTRTRTLTFQTLRSHLFLSLLKRIN